MSLMACEAERLRVFSRWQEKQNVTIVTKTVISEIDSGAHRATPFRPRAGCERLHG